MSHQYFALVSVIFALFGFVPYAHGITKGMVKPHLFSWLIWTLVTGLIFLAQLQEGGGAGAWAMAMISFLCGVTLVASIFCGEASRTRFDWICLLLALGAIPLWMISKTPTLSVSLLTLIEFIAFGPTVRKTIKNPYSESMGFYVICVLKYTCATLALNHFNFDTALYPVSTGCLAFSFILLMSGLRVTRNRSVRT